MSSDRSVSARFQRGQPVVAVTSLPPQHSYYGLPSSSSSSTTSSSHSLSHSRVHYPPTKDNNASAYLKPIIALIVLAAILLLCIALITLLQKDPAASLQSMLPAFATSNPTDADAAASPCDTAAVSSVLPPLPDIAVDPALAFAPHPALKPTPERLATLPSRCGNWMVDYGSFHASVSSGRYFVEQLNATGTVPVLPLLVYRVDPKARLGGISDRWPPLSMAMLVALLTRRAIFIDWPGYDAAYTHVHLPYLVNTTWLEVYGKWQWYRANADAVKTALTSGSPLPTPPVYDPANPPTVPVDDTLDTGTHDNGLTFPHSQLVPDGYIVIEKLTSLDEIRRYYQPSKPVVYATQAFWSKGLIRKFYVPGGMRDVMHGLGLRENVCHGCMINFLLSINRAVMRMFAPFALQLRASDVMTVGMQIRMGDASMTGLEGLSEKNKADLAWQQDDTRLLQHAHRWTDCAQQLLAVHATHANQSTRLFLVSDNTRVRSLLQQEFGDRLLVVPTGSSEFPIGHTDTGDPKLFNASRSTLQLERAGQYLRVAAGEQWILAYNDWLVIEHEGSGFGRSASFRSVKAGHTWNGRGRYRCDGEEGVLTVKDFDSFGHRY